MLAEQPDGREVRCNVALVHKYLGSYHQLHRDYARALSHFERARMLDEQRLAQDPTRRAIQLDVAIALSNVADVRWRQGDRQAIALFERSLAMRQALADSDPKDVFAQSRVAFVHAYLAWIYRALKELPRALEHGRAALRIREGIGTRTRESLVAIADTFSTVGDIEQAMGQRAAACVSYERSFTAYTRALVEDRTLSREDPLPAVARLASACGVKAAQAWLAKLPS